MKRLIDRIDSKPWPAEYLGKAVGNQRRALFCHAADEQIRRNAASGGAVSAVLIHLLESRQVAGVLLVASWVDAGRLQCGFKIARTREEILAAQGSKYMPVYFNREAVPLLHEFTGKLAAVLLPCDAQALSKLRAADPAINAKIGFVITLFCGHNSERELTDAVIERFRPQGKALQGFTHRFGHWRGSLRVNYESGHEVVKPFAEFSLYQNLFFFSQKKCHACFDHFGFYCDLAAGDIWSQKMKHEPIKQNAVIVRSAHAAATIQGLIGNGVLRGHDVSIEEVCNGQSRALPFHYNITARSKVGALFGMRLRDTTKTSVKWSEVAAAFLVMLNERITRKPLGRRIVLRIPRPILKAYLVFLKGLETL